MTSPWYRSRLFWFGLPGLLCLLWIWFGYLRKEAGVSWTGDYNEYYLGWGEATVAAGINKYPPSVGGPPNDGFHSSNEDLPPDLEIDAFVFPPVWMPKDPIVIGVANWFLVAVYLIVWIAALVIWQRRKRGFHQKVPTSQTPDTP